MRFWPGKRKNQSLDPVTDLDAIIVEPVPFKFKGKIHTLKVVDLATFLSFANAQQALVRSTGDDVALTPEDLGRKYLAVISPLCSTITLADIMSMEQVQIAALYQLVIDLISGQVDFGTGEKKKRYRLPIYDTVAPSSLPSAHANSDGPPQSH